MGRGRERRYSRYSRYSRSQLKAAREWNKPETSFKGGATTDELQGKIGSSSDDMTLGDTFNYQVVEPYYRSNFIIPTDWGSNKPISLKLQASKVLARHCHVLKPIHLQTGHWQTWSDVWDLILLNEMDTPQVFNMFATQFSSENFPTHHYHKVPSSNRSRVQVIADKTLNKRNHRLETIPLNTRNFPDCIRQTHFANLVILDLSSLVTVPKMDPRQFYIKLTNISTLLMLNCNSMTDIDDGVIKLWIMSLKLGKWRDLKMLCLKNTAVSEPMLQQLMLVNTKLYYLETSFKVLHPVNWIRARISDHIKFDTALRYFYVERNLKPSFLRNTDKTRKIILDYKVINKEILISQDHFKDHNAMNKILTDLWTHRARKEQQFSHKHYEYILNDSIKPTLIEDNKPKLKKPRIGKVKSHIDFFDL